MQVSLDSGEDPASIFDHRLSISELSWHDHFERLRANKDEAWRLSFGNTSHRQCHPTERTSGLAAGQAYLGSLSTGLIRPVASSSSARLMHSTYLAMLWSAK